MEFLLSTTELILIFQFYSINIRTILFNAKF